MSTPCVSCWIVFPMFLLSSPSCGREFTLGYMTKRSNRRPILEFNSGGAAPNMAIEKIQADGLLGNNTLKIIYRDDQYDALLSMGHAMELHENPGVDAFIGVGSSNALSKSGYLMSYWNLPVLSQSATDPVLQDKTIYTTLLRLVPPFNKAGDAIGSLFRLLKWKRVVLATRSTGLCSYSGRAVFSELSDLGVIIPSWITFTLETFKASLDEIITTIKQRARIVIFCGSVREKEKFLIELHKANLTTPEYVYIFPPLRPLDVPIEPWADKSNPNKDILLEASRCVIQLSLFTLDEEEVDAFKEEHVIKMAEYWNYNMTAKKKVTSTYATFLHDSVYLYALVLNKTLETGNDPRNGTQFVETAKSTIFKGVSGLVAFDANGDRQPTCSLWYVRPDGNSTVRWAEVILSNPLGQRMKVVEDIIWRTEDGSVPRDGPVCGYDGELCVITKADSLSYILSVVLVILLVILTAFFMSLCIKRRNMNQDLRQLFWRVNYDEISFVDIDKFHRSLMSLTFGLTASSARLSRHQSTSLVSSTETGDFGQLFTKVALYRGRLASVRFFQDVSLRESDRNELSVMGELKHDNVNQFIGACVDPNNPCTLTVYCEKGSLQDILENNDIQLDNIFKESLIFDLVNGMIYLHNSALRSHGNLKSSNCVIDSRWVLRVTDFHPTGVVQKEDSNAGEYEIFRARLWTAPEILRAHAPICRGSQAGDVFSFSIIVQEILYRALPYFMEDHTPREIVELVTSIRTTPFRPDCPLGSKVNPELIRLMKHCWEETPSKRLSFPEIMTNLERISERGKVSIMDRIIQKLEAYSSNLEDIVRDRTVALREEKAKTDSLLYQMLPAVVADKLKQGECVSPKLYEEATVYFSDIFGFMELAAESSPMEVVVLLNDLYEMLDDLSATFDVYKVETIGDSYMVVSGIPTTNGKGHVAEIADMSLRVLESTKTFKIRHKPAETIQLRIGFHTGSCFAGVVGLAMPRYCLFGDTVNTASRMESNGQALKIHISEETHEALSLFKGYNTRKRWGDIYQGKRAAHYLLAGREGRIGQRRQVATQ